MKKIALVLCAIMTFSCMNSVFAATVTDKTTESRNGVETFTDTNTAADMPSFRAGDTLKFDVSDLNVGTQLTIISYKVSDSTISNSTVQYIDQRTIDESTDTVSYKVRDIDDGIYCVSVKDGDSDAYTLYYKVGTPKFNVIKGKDEDSGAETNYYVKLEKEGSNGNIYSIGYLAAATFKTTELSAEDYGINGFGFKYSLDGTDVDAKPVKAQNDYWKEQVNSWIQTQEVNGEYSFYYMNTINNVPVSDIDNITAKATMYDSDGSTVTVEQ